MKKLLFLFGIAVCSFSLMGQDTFSICAVDPETGEVGSAGASCLDDDDIAGGVLIISDVHPGVGVVHTQSYWNPNNQNYAKQLMNEGFSPQEIMTLLVLNDVSNNPSIRQYGAVDLHADTGRAAAFTGGNCLDYKNHIVGPTYAIQGNILLGPQILDSMEARFLKAEGSLACRLMEAMQGANVVGADTRCAQYGLSSLSSFLRVAQPDDADDNLYLDLLVPKVYPGVDPIDSLQTLFDIWGGCIETGIFNKVVSYDVKVFPVPAKDYLKFTAPADIDVEDCQIFIYGIQGSQLMKPHQFENGQAIVNTSGLLPGIYFYKLIQSGIQRSAGKFVIE